MTKILDNAIDFLSMIVEDDFVMIYFIKKDNSKRLMKATLNFKKIPKEYYPKGFNLEGIYKKINSSNILSVFDLEKSAWRSIKLNQIISITNTKNKLFEYRINISDFYNIGK